jgi:hypothetical protein
MGKAEGETHGFKNTKEKAFKPSLLIILTTEDMPFGRESFGSITSNIALSGKISIPII